MAENDEAEKSEQSGECHRGIFTVPGALPIQTAWRDITCQPVRGKIWSASEGVYRTVFLEGKSGVIAFDTLTTPGTARAYGGGIQRCFPRKPVHTIIYSHDHLDHTGYAADLAPNAEIIAHDLCARVIKARKSDGQLPATEVWEGERKEFEIDGVRFELLYPGPTHGDGNAAAYFPESKVLFMVDTVIPGVGYTFFPDYHFQPYAAIMRRFLSLDWDLFIPGHFWIVDRKGFEANLGYFEGIGEAAQLAIADGVDPQDYEAATRYAQEKLEPKYGRLFRFDEYIGMNLVRQMQHYLMGGWGIEGNFKGDTSPF